MAVRFLDEAPPRKVRARFLDEEPDVASELPQDIPLEDAGIAPAPAMSEDTTLSAGLSGSNMPAPTQIPTLSEQDPRFPEVQAGVSGANALLDQTLLPTRLDWRNSLPVQEIRMQASIASAEAELARREVATIDPLNFPAIQAARDRRDTLLNRAEPMQAYAEQVRPRTGFEQQEIDAAKVAEQNDQFRRELNERGDAPGLLETANSKFWSKASDLAAGVLRQGAPDTAQVISQFGGEAGEMAGINTGARGKIGRGTGEVAFLAATMGRGGLPGVAAGTLAGAVAAREQVLRETGSTTEADKAALESYPALALYMLTGMAAAKGAAALVPENASKITKGLAGFAGAEVGNVAPSVVIRALNGQDYDLEAFTADTLMSAFHAVNVYRDAVTIEGKQRAKKELLSRGWSEEQLNQPFRVGAETPASMVMRAPEETAPFIPNETTPPIAPEAPQQARQAAAPIGEPPAPTPESVPGAEGALPRGIAETAQEAGVKYDGPMEIPGGAHQFTDQRTNSTFTVRGEFTPEKFADKLGQLRERYKPKQEVPAPDNLGPGAANALEPLPDTFVTSNKESVVNAERAARGLDPVLKEARITNAESIDRAESILEKNPERADQIIDRLRENPQERSISLEDSALLLVERAKIRTQRDTEAQRINDPNSTPEEVAQANERYNFWEQKLGDLDQAAQDARSTWGRFGQLWQRSMRSDLTLENMEAQARVSKGGRLTAEESDAVKKDYENVQRTEAAVDARREEVEVGRPLDDAIRAIEAEAAKNPDFTPEVRSLADRIVSRLDTAASAALKRLRTKFAQTNVGVDPTILADVAIYGASKIAKGLVKFGQWSASMVQDFGEGVKPYLTDAWKSASERLDQEIGMVPANQRDKVGEAVKKTKATATVDSIGEQMKARVADGDKFSDLSGYVQRLMETVVKSGVKGRDAVADSVHSVLKSVDPNITRRQTMEMMSRYGDFKPLNPDPVKAEVRDLKGQIQNVLKLEDIEAKRPLQKTGVERRIPSTEERSLIAKVNEAKKKYGVVVTDPAKQLKSATDAIETRLSNQIKDLTREIETGEGATKTTPPTNERIEYLKTLRDRVKETLEGIRDKKLTDAQRIESAKRGLQGQIGVLETRIRNGETSRPQRPKLSTPELEALRARRDALNAELDEIRSLDTTRTEEQKFDAVMKQADALEKRLASGDLSAKGKTQGPDTAMVSLAKERLNKLREEMLARKKSQNPPKPIEQRRLEAAEKAVEKSIAEYDRRLQAGEISARSKPSPVTSDALESRRAERDAMKALLGEMRAAARPRLTAEERALKAIKARLTKDTADRLERISKEDFATRTRKPATDISKDPEAVRLKAENEKVRRQFEERKYQWMLEREKTLMKGWRKIKEAAQSARNVEGSLDLSAPRQALAAIRAFPIIGLKSLKNLVVPAFSEKAAQQVDAQIKLRPNYENGVYKQMGLAITPLNEVNFSKAEENARSSIENWADLNLSKGNILARAGKAPLKLIGKGIRMSNRAFVSYLNTVRANVADRLLEVNFKDRAPTKEDLAAVGDMVNTLTGRGLKNSSHLAGWLLYSPNFFVARLKNLSGFHIWRPESTPRARKIALKTTLKQLASWVAIYQVSQWFSDKKEKDITSSDFGKMRDRNTRVDYTGGEASLLTAGARIFQAVKNTAQGRKQDRDMAGELLRQYRFKANPYVGAGIDWITGKTAIGEKTTLAGTAKRLFTPMAWGDVADTAKDVGITKAVWYQLQNMFGAGVNTYRKESAR